VVMQLRNLTTHRRATETLKMRAPDTSSAEWIAEAPTVSAAANAPTSAMTNFGTARFTDATATSRNGQAGPISDPAWRAGAIGFVSEQPGSRAGAPARFFAARTAAHAFPSALNSNGTAFKVTWRNGTQTGKKPPPGAI
jgi:Peptidase A4 family